MGLIERWLGTHPTGFDDRDAQVPIPSRRINVSDLWEAKTELEKVSSDVRFHRGGRDELGPELTEPLADSSDAALRRLVMVAYADGVKWPIVQVSVGADQGAQLLLNLHLLPENNFSPEQVDQWRAAAHEVLRVIGTAGRRVLGRRHILDLVQLALHVALIGLYAWFVIVVWPALPVILLAGLALFPVRTWAMNLVTRAVSRRIHADNRVIVRHLTRDEWRRQREDARRDLKVGFWTALITLVVTGVATFLGTIAALDETPAWWPF